MDSHNRASLLAVVSRHSGDWLHRPPRSIIGKRLNNEANRVAVKLRLVVNLREPHLFLQYIDDTRGTHGVYYKYSVGNLPPPTAMTWSGKPYHEPASYRSEIQHAFFMLTSSALIVLA